MPVVWALVFQAAARASPAAEVPDLRESSGLSGDDVLNAFAVTCPARAHAIKKLLAAGKRGGKSERQDLEEAVLSVQRSIELLGDDGVSEAVKAFAEPCKQQHNWVSMGADEYKCTNCPARKRSLEA